MHTRFIARWAGYIPPIALLSLFIVAGFTAGQTTNDPHRPPCADARCRKIESFLRANYCGKAPFGNGKGNSCELKVPKAPRNGIEVVADYECGGNRSDCQQHGKPSSLLSDILIHELRRLGLPEKAGGQTYFTVWKSSSPAWTLAAADYSRSVGNNVELCQVILAIDQSSHAIVLRELPFQTTDADVPKGTKWFPIGLAQIEGNGRVDIILEADAYENHWLEVISLHDGTAETIFSGLGYSL